MKRNIGLKDKIIRYIDAGFPIIYINSFEETKIDEIIQSVAYGREILEWNAFNGFVEFKTKTSLLFNYSFMDTLSLLKTGNELNRKLFVIKDVHTFFEDADIVAQIKGIANKINEGLDANIIIISSVLKIPKELEKYITVLEMDYITTEEIKQIIEKYINDNSLQTINESLLEEMSIAFRGLSEFEINNILALAYAHNGEFTRGDLSLIFEQKQQMVKKAGILEMIPTKENIENIGGLENLKDWLIRKAKIFKNLDKAQVFGVDMPKGVLIAGVPGCGKSLSAKVASKLFEVPLLRLDMGRLMGKYVGESEANMRNAITLAEAISPCVLWIDEIEKAFAGVGAYGGAAEVTTRLFGSFLTWMQEKETPVFVVATANDIIKLPTELYRKGRFDEIFYVELPNENERNKIFQIHIGKRRKSNLKDINISKLVMETKGYSGADIEGVVKESVEVAFADGKSKVTTEDILKVIKNTHCLSETMEDSLKKMTDECKSRKFRKASK